MPATSGVRLAEPSNMFYSWLKHAKRCQAISSSDFLGLLETYITKSVSRSGVKVI